MTKTAAEQWFDYKGRTSPFAISGEQLTDVVDSETAIKAGGLDWRVELAPLVGLIDTPSGIDESGELVSETTPILADRHRMSVRVDESGARSYLGVVGTSYEPLQNRDAFSFLDELVESVGGAHYECAGQWNGGRRVWIAMRLPGTIVVGDDDKIAPFLYAENGHDGSRALRLSTRYERLRCTNALPSLMSTGASRFSATHTVGMIERARVDAKSALQLVSSSMSAFQVEAQKMIETQLSADAFDRAVAQLFDHAAAKSARELASVATQREQLHELFVNAPTQESGRGTVWAGYNAVVEYVDWIRPTRSAHGDVAATRAAAQLRGTHDVIKRDALDLMLV